VGVLVWHLGVCGRCHAFWIARAMSSNIKKCHFIVLLKSLFRPLLLGETRVVVGSPVWRWRATFPLLLSLIPKNYSLTLLIVEISTSVFIILISDFFFILTLLYKFYKFLILSFNPNLPNIIFSYVVLILWISIFFP